MPAWSATDDVTLVGENAQPKINAIHSIILPFITTSFHYGTTAFCRPFERPNASFPNAAVNGQRCSQPPRGPSRHKSLTRALVPHSKAAEDQCLALPGSGAARIVARLEGGASSRRDGGKNDLWQRNALASVCAL